LGRKKEIAIVLVAIILVGGISYATFYYITSELVTITVAKYILTLEANITSCTIGDSILFNGTLKYGDTLLNSQNITLCYSNDTWTRLWDLTNALGQYEIVWTATSLGTFQFYTNTTIP